MKKVLIVTPSFNHGGTNRSLWNFLNTKQSEDFEVSILAMNHCGPYKEKFSKYNLLSEIPALSALFPMVNLHGIAKLKRIAWKLVYKVIFRSNSQRLFGWVSKKLKKCNFDVVAAFQEGMTTEFASYIPAKKRLAWVRCDYSNYLKLANKTDELEIYGKFDKIVCVSKYTAGVFGNCYPGYKDKVMPIYNIIDTDGIIETSKNDVFDESFKNDKFTLVSVGRMDVVKRFKYIPEIAKVMKDNNCDFRWYIIGAGGTEEPNVKEKIAEHNVGDCVILLGQKNNPYPYIANSDVLVCPSITEACPNVVNEAKILHIPAVAADFPSAPEYIDSGINGVISTMDNMASTLTRLCLDKEYYNSVKSGISTFEYKNDEIRKSLERLMID